MVQVQRWQGVASLLFLVMAAKKPSDEIRGGIETRIKASTPMPSVSDEEIQVIIGELNMKLRVDRVFS